MESSYWAENENDDKSVKASFCLFVCLFFFHLSTFLPGTFQYLQRQLYHLALNDALWLWEIFSEQLNREQVFSCGRLRVVPHTHSTPSLKAFLTAEEGLK